MNNPLALYHLPNRLKFVGNELFEEVTELTGIPKELISAELVQILEAVGATPESMTIEQLREAMAGYLAGVLGSKGEEDAS